jgi:RNA polymerase sigma-70 factor (ECF subfamily)
VKRSVAAIVGDHHEAEDITHNVFAKLIANINKYEPREAHFTAWILRVARNAALDHMRTRRAVPIAEPRPERSGDVDPVANNGRLLRTALGQLPDDQREVLVLRHIVGLSPPEIATVLGKTESSVNGLHNRGRRSLKVNLTALGAAPTVSATAK